MTYHAPIKIIVPLHILKGTKAGIKGTVAVAEVSGLEVDLVDGDVAAVATGLVRFVFGNCFDDQLEMIKF